MKHPRFKREAAALLVIAGLGLTASHAGPVIQNGVRFIVSPNGLSYFKANFGDVLERNKIKYKTGEIENTVFELDNPFSSESLPATVQERERLTIESISRKIGHYFRGFSLGNPKFKITLAKINYQAVFKTFEIELDPRGQQNYGVNRGVVAVLRLESSNFCVKAPTIRGIDVRNPRMLGTIGGDGLWIAHGGAGCANMRTAENATQIIRREESTRPLKVEAAMHLDTDANGLTIKPLSIKTNLQQTSIMGDFKKGGLLLPRISIMINGTEYPMEASAIEADVRKALPELLSVVAASMKTYAEKDEDTKKMIQKELAAFAKEANMEYTIPIPDAPASEPPLKMALKPIATEFTGGRFQLGFSTDVRDPTLAGGAGMFAATGSASAPSFANAPSRPHDVAIVVHPGILNGVLQRTYDRGFFSELDIGDGEKAKVTKAPVFSFAATPTGNLGRLRIAISYEVNGGIEDMFVRRPIPIEFDVLMRLESTNNNSIELVLAGIDTDTVAVTTRDVTLLGMFQRKVKKTVISRLKKKSDEYASSRQTRGAIPAPDEVLGLPLRLVDAKIDNGNIVIYSRFDVR